MIRLLILFFFFNTAAFAQHFKGGLIVGISTSQVDGDNLGGYTKAGLKAGALVYRKLSDKFSLQFELEFIQKGSRRPLNEEDNSFYLMRLNDIDAPLFLQYALTKNWVVEAGPAIGTLVSAYEEDERGSIRNAESFHRFDYLANAGVNYFISRNVAANVRYSYSVVSIRRSNATIFDNFYFNPGQYNNMIAFSLVFLIGGAE
jgi:opacity protein-like surface antigen